MGPTFPGEPVGSVELVHARSVTSAAWSPDGAQLLTGAQDGARIWDVSTGIASAPLTSVPAGNFGRVDDVAFSPSGSHLALLLPAGVVFLDASTRAVVTVTGHAWSGNARGFCFAGNDLVCRAGYHALTGISAPDGSEVFRVPTTAIRESCPPSAMSLVAAPDGESVFVGDSDNGITRFHRAGEQSSLVPQSPELGVGAHALAASDGALFSGSSSGEVRRWALDGTVVWTSNRYPDPVCALALSPNGSNLAVAAGGDRTLGIEFLSADTGRCQSQQMIGGSPVVALSYSPSGAQLAAVTSLGRCFILKTTS